MSKTLAECHAEVVAELQSRGEAVYNPTAKSMLNGTSCTRPKVYVKGRKFPSKDFLCGTAIRGKDGSINILQDPMADLRGVKGFEIEELGLCDPVLSYANGDQKTYPLKNAVEESTLASVVSLEEKVEVLEKRIKELERKWC